MKTFIPSLFAAIAAADDTEKIDKVVSTSTANEGGFEIKIVGDDVFKTDFTYKTMAIVEKKNPELRKSKEETTQFMMFNFKTTLAAESTTTA